MRKFPTLNTNIFQIHDWPDSWDPFTEKQIFIQYLCKNIKITEVQFRRLEKPYPMNYDEKQNDNDNEIRMKDHRGILSSSLQQSEGFILNCNIYHYYELKVKQNLNTLKNSDIVPGTNVVRDQFYHARMWKYKPKKISWEYTPIIVRVLGKINIEPSKKGSYRDLYSIQRNSYKTPLDEHTVIVAKRYHLEINHRIDNYFADIRSQIIAGYYAILFNLKIKSTSMNGVQKYEYVNMLDAVHIQIFSNSECIEIIDMFNVEFLGNDEIFDKNFKKFTNNSNSASEELKTDLATAFTHFTHNESGGTLMVVDIQGWSQVFDDGVEHMRLTDPAIHCPLEICTQCGASEFYGFTNGGVEGFDKFWNGQHKECNSICKGLGLKRPEEFVAKASSSDSPHVCSKCTSAN